MPFRINWRFDILHAANHTNNSFIFLLGYLYHIGVFVSEKMEKFRRTRYWVLVVISFRFQL